MVAIFNYRQGFPPNILSMDINGLLLFNLQWEIQEGFRGWNTHPPPLSFVWTINAFEWSYIVGTPLLLKLLVPPLIWYLYTCIFNRISCSFHPFILFTYYIILIHEKLTQFLYFHVLCFFIDFVFFRQVNWTLKLAMKRIQ